MHNPDVRRNGTVLAVLPIAARFRLAAAKPKRIRSAIEKMLLSHGAVSLETGMAPTDHTAMTHFDLSVSIEERVRMPASSDAATDTPLHQ